MFIGRDAELKFLENYYNRDGSQVVVVYGQRGVGKTALLKRFSEDKISTYYAARACSSREQRYQWACELRETGKSISRYPEYAELFQNSVDEGAPKKRIIIFDEFHHLIKSDAAFMSEIISFLGNRPSQDPVMIVLCTSASGWVENRMIRRLGSAAQAINGLLKVREMKFPEIRKMFPGYSREDYVELYAIAGGIPGLWNSFTPDRDARENIIHNVLAKESRLYGEISVLMAEELREPAVYNTILAALAGGLHKLNDIYKHTGFSRAKISVYLKNLMELELVEKVYSFETENHADTQKGIYRIRNSYVRFYYRFLFPNMSLLQDLTPEQFYEQKLRDGYSSFVEEAYRELCREAVGENASYVGEWLGKTGSIDIVASGRDGSMIVAVCRYAAGMGTEDYERLLNCRKKAGVPDAALRLYCEKGFSRELLAEAEEGRVRLCHII